ncbi:MAG: NAD(P)/FAD-dependent oxidoreductase [Myxococcales bacterium]|nr:NAD(P)/FAD-dependent oxidoreductase [Myxococcales bacterium]
MSEEQVDVLIVGAGISGIGAAYHLQERCPGRSYAIAERRESSGGTWDFFRYPGIRSDSDMYTLGYSFRPWTDPKAIADGPSILKYVRATAEEYGIDRKIRYGLHVKRASWSSAESAWTVEALRVESGEVYRFRCNFLFMCSGYYNYDAGYTPDFEGVEDFRGEIVHPQKWTSDIAYEGKRVAVIGSGATAVTLVPELARKAAHVTMVQRSPTYMVSLPSVDPFATWSRRHFSSKVAYGLTRWKNVLLGILGFNFCRRWPEAAKRMLRRGLERHIRPGYDIDRHFTPPYNPWEQRMCLVPDSDFFDALNAGSVSIATDHIDRFTEKGLALRSGEELEADLIVTATGLDLQLMGGLELSVDGEKVEASESMTYKSMMFSDVPNLALSFGYTNASWTLKCDLTCEYVARLLNHMDAKGYTACIPRRVDPSVEIEPMLNLTSGYIMRSVDAFPKQGTKAPWRLYQNYVLDKLSIGLSSIEDESLEFSTRPRAAEPALGIPPEDSPGEEAAASVSLAR